MQSNVSRHRASPAVVGGQTGAKPAALKELQQEKEEIMQELSSLE